MAFLFISFFLFFNFFAGCFLSVFFLFAAAGFWGFSGQMESIMSYHFDLVMVWFGFRWLSEFFARARVKDDG
jgi:hypothetical protein